MSRIEATAASQLAPLTQDSGAAAAADVTGNADATANAPGIAVKQPGTDVRISMSGSALASRGTAKEASTKDSDIDNSNLPDNVKKLIKRLRELREKLEQKVQELQELSNSTAGSPEQRRMRIEALRSEVGALTAAMNSVSADLAQATRKFTSDEKKLVGSLIMG
ncbi:hypothetical protein LMG23992_00917 [Cupriavidus laharis]|uniref:Chemotaxis protein n=1 Tax=Cupriavidus laharis TaxID=151654 RepID=A0ABM8WKE9_9BURK|nr:hypothetical protein [Cupriavidus laharis]CAG9167801.1 hypothetical protein LMG23992_00917 [Cupriavidus laharis]